MIYFDVLHPYYLPQYLPVSKQLLEAGEDVVFVIYKSKDLQASLHSIVEALQLTVIWVDNKEQAIKLYKEEQPNWVIFGNAFAELEQLRKRGCKTALMQHGIGPKSCYYDVSESDFDVRFVEGQYRLKRLKQRFPEKTFIDTGYAKLDPIINGTLKAIDLEDIGLNSSKKTLLYAPTFYPSSIEKMDKRWPEEFKEYNVIIKPHYFSLIKPNYKKHKRLLDFWSQFENVYLAPIGEINLNPFMQIADVLISDASSAIFEFTALNKPVVWCDFYKLRWAYRGIFSYRFKKRMDQDLYRYADIAAHAKSYRELKSVVDSQISMPESYENKRATYTLELAGVVDGKSASRIAHYLVE